MQTNANTNAEPISSLTDDQIESAIAWAGSEEDYSVEDVRHVLQALNENMNEAMRAFRSDAENIVYEDDEVLVYDDSDRDMLRETYIDAGLEKHVRNPEDRMRDIINAIMEDLADDITERHWRDSFAIVVEKTEEN